MALKMSISYKPMEKIRVQDAENREWSYEKILLHIPHSSMAFPSDSRYTFEDLDGEERLLIDYYTDDLFSPARPSADIERMTFPLCRLYCDVERLINDPLEKEGLGISYHRSTSGQPLGDRMFGNLAEAFSCYVDFHAEMAKKIVSMGEGTLLVDCHSFSSRPTLLCSNPPDVDICIGYNEDSTHPDAVALPNIVRHFKSRGYKVGLNEPFSNSKTFDVPVKYHSVMIEVNKRLYMDEDTLAKSDGYCRLRQDIQEMYDMLLGRNAFLDP